MLGNENYFEQKINKFFKIIKEKEYGEAVMTQGEVKMNEAEIVLIEKARALDVLCHEIKGEAQRRILVKVPEQMQRNLLMQALHLVMHTVPANDLKLCDRKAWQEIDESWQEIDKIRHISDELEFAAEEGNLPRNWKQDVYWG